MSRRLTTLDRVAQEHQVTKRTIRNWIGRGYFPAYRIKGHRALYVDLDEVDAALRRLPRTKVRSAAQAFGPDAQIIELPARATEDEK